MRKPKTKNKTSPGIVTFFVLTLTSLPTIGYSQAADFLATQLQFENFYGAKYRSSNHEAKFTGSEFLIDEWLPIEVEFLNGSAKFEQGKLNLTNSAIEVIYKDKEMLISSNNFKSIKLLAQSRLFVSAAKFYYKDISLRGLVEIFEPSPKTPYILAQHYVYIREASSNGYINAGTLDNTRVKATNIFLHTGISLIPIKNKNDLGKYYSKEKQLFNKLRKELNPDFRNPKSLDQFVKSMEIALKNRLPN